MFGEHFNNPNGFIMVFVGFNVKFLIYSFDWMASGVRKLKIPDYVWDANNPKYKPAYAHVFSFLTAGIVADAMIDQIRPIMADAGVNMPENIGNRVTFAAACGVWNGLVDVVASVPDILKFISVLSNDEARDGLGEQFHQFMEMDIKDEKGDVIIHKDNIRGKSWSLIKSAVKEMFPSAST